MGEPPNGILSAIKNRTSLCTDLKWSPRHIVQWRSKIQIVWIVCSSLCAFKKWCQCENMHRDIGTSWDGRYTGPGNSGCSGEGLGGFKTTVRVRLHFRRIFFCTFPPLNHVHVLLRYVSRLLKMGREFRIEDGPGNGVKEPLYQRLVRSLPRVLSLPALCTLLSPLF